MNRLDGHKLLLVEDNPGDAGLILDLLARTGEEAYEVRHVETLAAAANLIGSEPIDAVLLDLRLPDCYGVECVKTLRAKANGAAIVALTGLENQKLALECLAAGAQDYLGKDEIESMSLRRAIAYAVARMREIASAHRAEGLSKRLAAIVESSSDAIISCRPDGSVTSWNRGATQIFGHREEEAMGQPVFELIRPLQGHSPEQQVLMHLALAGTFGAPREVERVRKDGSVVVLSAVAFPLPETDGIGAGFGAICRDITDKRMRERELRNQNAQLVARDRQMRALTARLHAVREEERIRISREVHDELGQLLTGIKMDMRWVNKRLEDQTALRDKLVEAEVLIDRTIGTIQRIAAELRPSVLDALGLPAAIRDEVRLFEERTGIRATLDVEDASLPGPEASTALFRIFQEVLTNVARHARASALSVALDCRDEGWELRVRDDGVGFVVGAAADVTSLGLLGMTERAAMLNGSIDIDSRPGLGTKVTVRIPRAERGDGL